MDSCFIEITTLIINSFLYLKEWDDYAVAGRYDVTMVDGTVNVISFFWVAKVFFLQFI